MEGLAGVYGFGIKNERTVFAVLSVVLSYWVIDRNSPHQDASGYPIPVAKIPLYVCVYVRNKSNYNLSDREEYNLDSPRNNVRGSVRQGFQQDPKDPTDKLSGFHHYHKSTTEYHDYKY